MIIDAQIKFGSKNYRVRREVSDEALILSKYPIAIFDSEWNKVGQDMQKIFLENVKNHVDK